MTAINVVIRMTLERDVWEEELFETIRNARGINDAKKIMHPLPSDHRYLKDTILLFVNT